MGNQLAVSVSGKQDGCINISNAFTATSNGNLVKITDTAFGNGLTNIHNINSTATSGDVYDIGGRLVKKNASSVEKLDKGVYLMEDKKVLVK
jgi:hypothetical protein